MDFGEVLSGKAFNEKTKGKVFVRFTNSSENHNGFQYKDGLNVDTEKFNPRGSCTGGGLYFCEGDQFTNHYQNHTYLRFVTIPSDAKVYVDHSKFKANKFILGKRIEFDYENILSLIYTQEQFENMMLENVDILHYLHRCKNYSNMKKIYMYAIRKGHIDIDAVPVKLIATLSDNDLIEIITESEFDVDSLVSLLRNSGTSSEKVLKIAIQKNVELMSKLVFIDYEKLFTEEELIDLYVEDDEAFPKKLQSKLKQSPLFKKAIASGQIHSLLSSSQPNMDKKKINDIFTEEELVKMVEESATFHIIFTYLLEHYTGFNNDVIKKIIKTDKSFLQKCEKSQLKTIYNVDELLDLLFECDVEEVVPTPVKRTGKKAKGKYGASQPPKAKPAKSYATKSKVSAPRRAYDTDEEVLSEEE